MNFRTRGLRFLTYWLLICGATLVPLSAVAAKPKSAAPAAKPAAPPKMPSPNAHDTYMSAGAALVDIDAINQAAVAHYTGEPVASDESQKLVAKNLEALKLLRTGLAQEYRYPYLRDARVDFPEYDHYRPLVRLLVLDGVLKLRSGDKAGAVKCYLEGIELGVDVPCGGNLLPTMIGWALETISRRALWETVNDLDAATARLAVEPLEALGRRRTSLRSALVEDKRLGLTAIPQIAKTLTDKERAKYLKLQPQIATDYSVWMEKYMANLQKPYLSRQQLVLPTDPFCAELLPVYKNSGFHDARNLTGNALPTTAIALRAYRAETGGFPATLDLLAPKYLKAIPADPYGGGESLRYAIKNEKYVLYSIGPDGNDDGGRAIDDTARKGNTRYAIAASSNGDFVAGINY